MKKTIEVYNKNIDKYVERYNYENYADIIVPILQTFSFFDASDPHKPRTVLEIGSGTGKMALIIANAKRKVIGHDASLKMVEFANLTIQRDNVKFEHKQYPLQNVEKNTYDAAYSIATLMHMSKKDIADTVVNVYKMLKENGVFIIMVPTKKEGLINNRDEDGRFFNIMNSDEWKLLCNRCGFFCIGETTSKDRLGRNVEWSTFFLMKQSL